MCAMPMAPTFESLDAEADPLIGRVVNDRYRIVEQIGHGGMGRVYRALQSPLDRVIALKVLGAGHDRDPNFYKRFFLEASVTAKLTHPNTITLFDYGRTDDGIFFIAMEYLAGRTLSAVMQEEGPLAQDRVIHIAQQICRSLREAHALSIVHRDLKPANVMLMRQQDDLDFVKVLDFGLVKFFSGDNPEGEITNAGTFMGSPHYIAPEQARNQNPDQRCDIYSLGILMYQMLTGRVPFTAQNPVDIILKHLHDPPPPPSQMRPDLEIAPAFEALILKCLEKDRLDRFQSMDELLMALKVLRASLHGGAVGLSMPPPSETYVGARPQLQDSSNTPPSMLTPSAPMQRTAAMARGQTGKHAIAQPPPPPADISGPSSVAFEPRGQKPEAAAAKKSRAPLVAALGAVVLGGASAAAYFAMRGAPEAPAPVAVSPAPAAIHPPATAPAAPVDPSAAPAANTLPAAPAAEPAPSTVPTALTGTTLVHVISSPSGAEVRDIDERVLGNTPFDLRVPSNKPLQLTLRADGYKPAVLKERNITGERVELTGALKRDPKSGAKAEPGNGSKRSVGYKDDPY